MLSHQYRRKDRFMTRSRVAFVLFLAVVMVCLALTVAAAEDKLLEELLIEQATTPEQHQAIARYYRTKADGARKEVENHRAMRRAYTATKFVEKLKIQEHCDQLIAHYEAVAKEFDALATMHQSEAQKR
jgi:hypothetical protein